ncbi:MAG TPA: alpha/beta fold hydrolase [Egibacteraceae bacterium]|nr:alpha/beta fold hydrolase [Egibacteraceae bacterium]
MEIAEFLQHRRTVRTPVGEISYTDVGEGPAALFVHGVLVNGLLWRNLVGQVADVRRCVAIDLPLHGGSPPTADMSFEGFADAVAALHEALDLGPVDLVGNDTGGLVCQLFAAAHPGRLRTLTLTNCDVHDRVPPDAFKPAVELARQGQFARGLRAVLEQEDPQALRDAFAIAYEHPERLPVELLRAYLEPVVGTPERGELFDRRLAAVDPDTLVRIEPQLRGLDVPALLAWGTADEFFPLDDARTLLGILPRARLVTFEGAKLFFADERAAELAPHVREHWLAHEEVAA